MPCLAAEQGALQRDCGSVAGRVRRLRRFAYGSVAPDGACGAARLCGRCAGGAYCGAGRCGAAARALGRCAVCGDRPCGAWALRACAGTCARRPLPFFACQRNTKKGTRRRRPAARGVRCGARGAGRVQKLAPAGLGQSAIDVALRAPRPRPAALLAAAHGEGDNTLGSLRIASATAHRCARAGSEVARRRSESRGDAQRAEWMALPYAAPRSAGARGSRRAAPSGAVVRAPAGGEFCARPREPSTAGHPSRSEGRRIRVAFLWFLSLARQRKELRRRAHIPATGAERRTPRQGRSSVEEAATFRGAPRDRDPPGRTTCRGARHPRWNTPATAPASCTTDSAAATPRHRHRRDTAPGRAMRQPLRPQPPSSGSTSLCPVWRAMSSAVSPRSSRRSRRAPRSSSRRTASTWPCPAAHISGVSCCS